MQALISENKNLVDARTDYSKSEEVWSSKYSFMNPGRRCEIQWRHCRSVPVGRACVQEEKRSVDFWGTSLNSPICICRKKQPAACPTRSAELGMQSKKSGTSNRISRRSYLVVLFHNVPRRHPLRNTAATKHGSRKSEDMQLQNNSHYCRKSLKVKNHFCASTDVIFLPHPHPRRLGIHPRRLGIPQLPLVGTHHEIMG